MRGRWSRGSCILILILAPYARATEGFAAEPAIGPQPHPQLTPLGYKLSAQKEQELAGRRQGVKKQRLSELGERLTAARTQADVGLTERLEAIIKRVEAGPPPVVTSVNAWGSEHVAHMRALDQWQKYGAQLYRPEVVDEFDKHALRIAKLRRIREVTLATAASTEREVLLSQIETTMELEGARHVEQLERWLVPVTGTLP